jgi:serine/threonine-protein kinase HipA
MADRLIARMYDTPVAVLSPAPNYRLTLAWDPAGIDRWGLGSRVLSVSLPLGAPLRSQDNRGLDFFENLLPEGPALEAMARVAKVPGADTYGLLAAFGQDCAGAITVIPADETPPDPAAARYVPMTDQALAAAIGSLGSIPLGLDPQQAFRPSLPGFQRKLLTGRAPDGTWQKPAGGAPSTWIIKPDGRTPMAANELTCLRLAAACGLTVPEAELVLIEGIPALAIRRYDRAVTPAGPLRLHQEDGCQAAGRAPAEKYEEAGGPSLRTLAGIIRNFGDPRDTADLLRRVVFNVAVGNADAHAKNFSFLHPPGDPAVQLAPVYDVVSTLALQSADDAGRPLTADPTMGQRVAGVRDIREVTQADLVAEAVAWGVRRTTAARTVAEMTERIAGSGPDVAGDERVLAVIARRAAGLAAGQR